MSQQADYFLYLAAMFSIANVLLYGIWVALHNIIDAIKETKGPAHDR